ncbi:chromate transporter [Clostridium botulinum]|uniref:Chromate transporter protein n=3 Tax=Clostridium botulinum TaxID=1491 RepID=C1FT05_CLOBJ|nr:chromate transporter [Clostridium botulinum]EKN40937.1 chromate transporter protein [Clostridium botulinum CFSAN001627]ACO87189.1 chromate transporter protein [Clostridium botulinum A2 str. Kyoto]APC78556.1 chromate transporter family protein [Clostridium botulinum]APC85615.1 chromate transporter family protein [Clostridium botulinum]AUM98041.1 chromate transporter [Clostridium botulinum]
MKALLELFFSFLKIGMFSFGGGYAMLPLIEREIVHNKHWINYKSFIDIIGISQMTPGPIAINSATFVGYKVAGFKGSLVATLGVITFSFILVTIATHFIIKFKESNILKSALMGMRPALIGLIIYAFLSLASQSYIDLKSIIIGIITFILLLSKKIHPILIIVISGILGIIFYGFIPF